VFWDRFRLTLPGRITVAKTFMVAQLNYAGSFLKPSDIIISEIQEIINNFVKGSMNIAREKICSTTASGGLGMLILSDFLAAHRCAWISRAHRLQIDNWRYDLKSCSPNYNIAQVRPCDVDSNLHPILYNLVCDFRDFYGNFSKVNGNYKAAYIFDNPAFCWGPDFTGTLNINSLGPAFYTANRNLIRKLKFSDCFIGRNFKTVAEFATDGLNLSWARWMQLRTCILRSRDLLKKDEISDKKIDNIDNFLLSDRKGSKRFRMFFEKANFTAVNPQTNRALNTFARLIDLPVPAVDSVEKIFLSWTHSFIGNRTRDFIFKFRNNYLALNNRVNAYNQQVDPRCTFCRIRDPATVQRESLSHTFYDCPTSSNAINHVIITIFNHNLNAEEKKEFYWNGAHPDPELRHCKDYLLLIWDLVRYIIYQYKQKRVVPNHIMILNDLIFCIRTTLMVKRQFRHMVANVNSLADLAQALG
jgi:hypothetical protein